MLELIVLCISAVANVILALLVFVNNPRGIVNRYFFLFVMALISWTVINYISLYPFLLPQLLWVRLALAAATLLSMFLLLAVNVFPNSMPAYKHLNRWAIFTGIPVTILTMTPLVFSDLQYNQGVAVPIVGPAILLFGLYAVGGLLLAVLLLVHKFRHSSGLKREQAKFALVGIATSFGLIIFSNFILVAVFGSTILIPFAPAYSLIFTVIFAYIILRHHLFDIRLLIARFVAYLFFLLVVGSLYSFITVILSYLLTGIQPSLTQILVSAVIVDILILFVQPLRAFFNRVTRAVFYQDAYETKDVLDKLASVLVRSTNIDLLANKSINILSNALKPEEMTMLLVDETQKDGQRLIYTGKKKPKALVDFSADDLVGTPALLFTDILEGQSGRLRTKMQRANIAIIARLETKGGIIGYCFFGYKTSGSVYNQRDIDLIRIACDELAVAIENAVRFEQIQAFNETLQQRIQEATKELRTTNSQLQRLDEAKDEFISMASHQLRTPLTSVKGYISMVLEEDAGKITNVQRQLLDEAFASSERMVHLINDFLNVSRLQTGKFMLEQRPTDLSKVVAEEVDSLQSTVRMHALKLKYKQPSYFPLLALDEAKIRQVIMNFIDNAIYYSTEGTLITVELAIEDAQAILKVIDTGIGVPKNEQQHLFSKFFRATNARRQRPDGTGVGLFLAKKIIDAHGGSILFESAEGKGSTFGFRLPIKKLTPKDTEGTK